MLGSEMCIAAGRTIVSKGVGEVTSKQDAQTYAPLPVAITLLIIAQEPLDFFAKLREHVSRKVSVDDDSLCLGGGFMPCFLKSPLHAFHQGLHRAGRLQWEQQSFTVRFSRKSCV